MCELCRFDALYYGRALRFFEGAVICLGCYLTVHDSAFDAPDRQQHETTFLLDLANGDLRPPLYRVA